MILVTERFFVAKEQWAAFEAQCQTLAGIMAGRPGCYHQCLVRGSVEFPSHIRYSAWESLERFREWTRSDAFMLVASGAASPPFLAPKQTEVQVVPPEHQPRSGPLLATTCFAEQRETGNDG